MSRSGPFWPAPLPRECEITVGQTMPVLNLSRLDPVDKRAHWQTIRRERPQLAELLTDPQFQDLAAAFDADVCVYLEDLPNGDD
ncbi:hypothetical protein H0Z60_10075 [Ectothiorhodospiraceae bacterium WFHF3C12]|nr:hypothetical protein [Ectothiorhodospiraceae bacterium WFHF3C12]